MLLRSTIFILCLSIVLAPSAAWLVHTSSAFWLAGDPGASINSKNADCKRVQRPQTMSLSSVHQSSEDTSSGQQQRQQQRKLPLRQETVIRLAESGKEVTLISRTVPIFPNTSITVWEWKNSATVVNAYWEAQGRQVMATVGSPQKPMLDPFGLVSWPGSVLAARELYKHAETAVANRNVVILGAGVGLETQAAAMLGPKRVVATDIHPTTLRQLELGVSRNEQIQTNGIVETQILDLFRTKKEQPVPSPCDLLVVADVLYSEQLASQVCRRCAEALEANPQIRILITDSQRFVPGFLHELNKALQAVVSTLGARKQFPKAAWRKETMKSFEGSGVIIDEDQTYDVTVQSLWIGL